MAWMGIFPQNLGYLAAIIVAIALAVLWVRFSKVGKNLPKGTPRHILAVGGLGLLIFGIVGTGLGSTSGFNLGQPLAAGAVPTVTAPATTTTTTTSTSSAGTTTTGTSKYKIETFSISSQEKYSNSQTAVGNNTYGFLKIYPAEQNPSDANANAIATINITSGTASDSTVAGVLTGTPYRVIFDGGAHNGWYDEDYKIISFDNKDFNPNTGTYAMSLANIARIATVDDPIDDASTTAFGGVVVTPTSEVSNGSSGDLGANRIVYNETPGDGVFYYELTHGYSVANSEVRNAVQCFEWDSSNPPEGNEYTQITTQLRSGTDLGIPSDITNYWTQQGCISLGTHRSGLSSLYRYTVTATEGNMEDGGDITNIRIDDLGAYRASDVLTANKGQDTTTVYLTSGSS